MNLKHIHQSNLELVKLAELIIGETVMDYEPTKGGISAEVLHVICKSGNEYAVRRRSKKNGYINYENNINLASCDDVLPKGFNAFDCGTFYFTYYDWIGGQTYREYRMDYADVLIRLSKLHDNVGYCREASSYANIVYETADVSKILENDVKLSRCQKNIVLESVQILKCLTPSDLEKMLNNRNHLTHGDIKPRNIVVNRDSFQLIDWDKMCSVSPEFELVYASFSGMLWESIYNIETWYKRILNRDILELSIMFLPHMYLIHDAYYYLRTGNRYEYLVNEVFPLYYSWKGKLCGP